MSNVEIHKRQAKVRPAPMDKMRVHSSCQRELRPGHVEYLLSEFDFNQFGYPVVNFREGIYWIIDGQHRIAVLKAAGFTNEPIDCVVYQDLTDDQMAEMFLRLNDRKAVASFDKFNVACTAERKRETSIRRMVEAQGLKISRQKAERCVSSVTALGRVYDLSGDVVLGQVLRTIRDAYAADPRGFDGQIIQGLGLVFNRYNGQTDEKRLVESLASMQHGPTGLLRRAEAQRERTGNAKVQCLAAAVVEAYNRGRRQKLDSWWKEQPA